MYYVVMEITTNPEASMKLQKISIGWYASEDGTWGVIGDNPCSIPTKTEERTDYGIHNGINTQREWQVAYDPNGGLREWHQAGETLGWFNTLRDAREYLAWRRQRDLA